MQTLPEIVLALWGRKRAAHVAEMQRAKVAGAERGMTTPVDEGGAEVTADALDDVGEF